MMKMCKPVNEEPYRPLVVDEISFETGRLIRLRMRDADHPPMALAIRIHV